MKHSVVLVPIIFWTGAACALTPNQWQYRQSIDVPATGLVQTGSRISYYLYAAGDRAAGQPEVFHLSLR